MKVFNIDKKKILLKCLSFIMIGLLANINKFLHSTSVLFKDWIF